MWKYATPSATHHLSGLTKEIALVLRTFGKWSPEKWNGIAYHEVLWSLLFAKTRQTPMIPNYVTSTATFLMVADAPGRARPYTFRTIIGSANPS